MRGGSYGGDGRPRLSTTTRGRREDEGKGQRKDDEGEDDVQIYVLISEKKEITELKHYETTM